DFLTRQRSWSPVSGWSEGPWQRPWGWGRAGGCDGAGWLRQVALPGKGRRLAALPARPASLPAGSDAQSWLSLAAARAERTHEVSTSPTSHALSPAPLPVLAAPLRWVPPRRAPSVGLLLG
uniref:Uncharacterized protein n=1 Tax=Taeniopygia guttata TaxID=59729 RepID=A0A674HFQ4_TAEGU